MPPSRSCRVTVRDVEGIAHSVQVSASTLFEAAAAAIATFRDEKWAAEALTPNAILRVEVQLPAVVHEIPFKAVERWLRSPNTSPREMIVKQRMRDPARD